MAAFRSVLKEGVLGGGVLKTIIPTTYIRTSRYWVLKRFSSFLWQWHNLKLWGIGAMSGLGEEGRRLQKLLP